MAEQTTTERAFTELQTAFTRMTALVLQDAHVPEDLSNLSDGTLLFLQHAQNATFAWSELMSAHVCGEMEEDIVNLFAALGEVTDAE